jgi:trans-aconitate methyltransferase
MRLEVDQIQEFYERCYSASTEGEKWARWRALGAVTKADHVVHLLERAGVTGVETVAEIGCGDGAVLEQLARRGIGAVRTGMDISSTAVAIAAGQPGISAVHQFDGVHIPAEDRAFDFVFATHVLEHVPTPEPLLDELARVSRRALLVEVPLERNLSARRPAARAASEAAGHLHRFDRRQIRRMINRSGWRIQAELVDPLPAAVHAFGKDTPVARARAGLKWLVRSGLTLWPPLGERLITLHYAVIATPQ